MKSRRKMLWGMNLVLGLLILSAHDDADAMAACDLGPACQCECLDAWDECAEGLSPTEAATQCDPAYNECYEENCNPQ